MFNCTDKDSGDKLEEIPEGKTAECGCKGKEESVLAKGKEQDEIKKAYDPENLYGFEAKCGPDGELEGGAAWPHCAKISELEVKCVKDELKEEDADGTIKADGYKDLGDEINYGTAVEYECKDPQNKLVEGTKDGQKQETKCGVSAANKDEEFVGTWEPAFSNLARCSAECVSVDRAELEKRKFGNCDGIAEVGGESVAYDRKIACRCSVGEDKYSEVMAASEAEAKAGKLAGENAYEFQAVCDRTSGQPRLNPELSGWPTCVKIPEDKKCGKPTDKDFPKSEANKKVELHGERPQGEQVHGSVSHNNIKQNTK